MYIDQCNPSTRLSSTRIRECLSRYQLDCLIIALDSFFSSLFLFKGCCRAYTNTLHIQLALPKWPISVSVSLSLSLWY